MSPKRIEQARHDSPSRLFNRRGWPGNRPPFPEKHSLLWALRARQAIFGVVTLGYITRPDTWSSPRSSSFEADAGALSKDDQAMLKKFSREAQME